MNAAAVRDIAGVIGACVAVVAVDRHPRTRLADPGVAGRTFGAVVTGAVIGLELAPRLGVTQVVCAIIVVVAGQLTAADAIAQMAVVAGGAKITVITRGRIEQVGTSQLGVAEVIRADILVVASQRCSATANSLHASFANGAGIAIVTGPIVGFKEAAGDPIAAIVGAWIPVLAYHGNAC